MFYSVRILADTYNDDDDWFKIPGFMKLFENSKL